MQQMIKEYVEFADYLVSKSGIDKNKNITYGLIFNKQNEPFLVLQNAKNKTLNFQPGIFDSIEIQKYELTISPLLAYKVYQNSSKKESYASANFVYTVNVNEDGKFGYLDALYVNSYFRKNNLATELLHLLNYNLHELDIPKIYLRAVALDQEKVPQHTVEDFYQKNGFTPEIYTTNHGKEISRMSKNTSKTEAKEFQNRVSVAQSYNHEFKVISPDLTQNSNSIPTK